MKKGLTSSIFLFFFLLLVLGLGSSTFAALTEEEMINIKIYKDVNPAVVNITTTTLVRDFFSLYPQKGSGSGTIIDANGYILTNYHVIEEASKIAVTMQDGSKYAAKVAGVDPENDLAVIKIINSDNRTFKAMEMAEQGGLQVGQKVFAIGNPFGLNSTLTTGIISATGRPLTTGAGRVIENVIQTDASINPGNSGGPLIDTDGKMIGINTAIFTPSGGSVGIGFAIPAATAKAIIPDLIKYGKLRRPWLGIAGLPLFEQLSAYLNLPVANGFLVSEVVDGSPSYRAGIRGGNRAVRISGTVFYLGGDIVVEVDGKKVMSMDDIKNALFNKKEGQRVNLKIIRGDKAIELTMLIELKA
ncbi:MAG: trypsin-like peptidase domain-containing protein [Candidatus Magnetoovum sp. WYHC-5]|nr:trypsin-like peptidase domain-containing protein [Candidatus Magnetoovum sp. WYHC-5]